MENEIDIEVLLKKNSRLIFKLDLALESYEDDTNNDVPLLKEAIVELNEFRKNKANMSIDEQYKTSEKILQKYNRVIDLVGRDNFIFYDDGDVNYIWKGGNING